MLKNALKSIKVIIVKNYSQNAEHSFRLLPKYSPSIIILIMIKLQMLIKSIEFRLISNKRTIRPRKFV